MSLTSFHPAVARWFQQRFGEPTAPQRFGWDSRNGVIYLADASNGTPLAIAATILTESALSFLGWGVKAPDTSLGLLISTYQNAFLTRPWLFWWPGMMILAIALAYNLMTSEDFAGSDVDFIVPWGMVVAILAITIVAASKDAGATRTVQNDLSFENLRIYTNTDVIGTEIGGSVKNVMAIAAGMATGLGFGSNSVAALITRGLAATTSQSVGS